uniref:Uncharacterized protein n=1 Tax=Rhizophora mucronata TaxID=61149 RepID=A0A2P2NBM4_RHIMU
MNDIIFEYRLDILVTKNLHRLKLRTALLIFLAFFFLPFFENEIKLGEPDFKFKAYRR